MLMASCCSRSHFLISCDVYLDRATHHQIVLQFQCLPRAGFFTGADMELTSMDHALTEAASLISMGIRALWAIEYVARKWNVSETALRLYRRTA